MPHAMTTRMSHIWYHADRHEQWKRVTYLVFVVEDVGLALAPKMFPDQSQAFSEVNNNQAFTVGRKKSSFFSGRAASRCSKACLYRVSRKYSKNWLRRTNIKSNLTPEIEYTLKPSNYDAEPWFLHFTAPKSIFTRRFWEIYAQCLHTCLMCPCRAFCGWVFLFLFFFSLDMWDPLRPKYPKNYKNPNIWRKYVPVYMKKRTFVKDSAGAH